MIERYGTPEMAKLWSTASRYKRWLEVELLVCEARAELGLIPADSAVRIRRNACFEVSEIEQEEDRVKHDVAAFVSVVGRSIGEDACYFHEGLTSSDILDTALATQLLDSTDLIMDEILRLKRSLKALALKYKMTPMIGRTHGIHAEPITFGLKVAVWFADLDRCCKRLMYARKEVSVGKISGAVGNFAHVLPTVEALVCKWLGLEPELAATQVVQRDRHAVFMAMLAVISGFIEKVAIEIRHLQRSEVMEVFEPFSKGQKGSSAMPHKKNPVLCENLTGLARLVRSNTHAAFENIALWHERDISHSSVERVILPDSTILVHFMLKRLNGIISRLHVRTEQMKANLNRLNGLIFSQKVLLGLTEKGIPRERAYEIVQRNALKTWDGDCSFQDNLKADPDVGKLCSATEITGWFEIGFYLLHIEDIFQRVGLDTGEED